MTKNRKRWLQALVKGRSIKAKLAQAFLAFGFAILLLGGAFAWHSYQEKHLSALKEKMHRIEANFLRAERVERDFFIYETRNIDFFNYGKSNFLNQRKKIFKIIKQDLRLLQANYETQSKNIRQRIKLLHNHAAALDQSFDKLVSFTRKRGFKNTGLEGKMRQLIHKIEDDSTNIDLNKILNIRRSEKDFIIRKDTMYLQKVQTIISELAQDISQNSSISQEKKRALSKQLQLYQDTFIELVETEKIIGLKASEGLKGNIQALSVTIDQDIEILSQQIIQKVELLKKRLQWIMYALLLIASLLVIGIGLYIARQLGKPITELSNTIYYIIAQDFKEGIYIPRIDTKNEIGRLARDLKAMYEKLLEHNQKIESQSQEISAQRDLLVKQNHDILEAQEEIRQANEKLWNWKNELEKRVEERTEELQKTNDELDFFLYRASHDLKGPLASLQGLIQLAEMEIKTATQRVFFERFNTNVRQLNRLLDKFLMIFEVHHEENKLADTSLEQLWQDSLHRLDQWHVFSPNLFQINTEGASKCYTNATLLEIILLNLLDNVLVFGKNYPCNITLTALPHELILYIKDRGEGIPPAFLPERIFDMFFRGSEKSTGNGLGLYIVQKAVEKLQGSINVESILDKQTIFSVTIPLSPKP